jgi:hypothetical protein
MGSRILRSVVCLDLAQPHSHGIVGHDAAQQLRRDIQRRPLEELPLQRVAVVSHHQGYLYITRPAGMQMYRQAW